jgi:antitoxin component YwqK of YwqJK toxin-antitoxin module
MVQKERLHFRYIIVSVVIFCFLSCTTNPKKEVEINSTSFFVDTTLIPKDTVLSTASSLKLDNGIYYLNNLPFSGYRKDLYENKQVSLVAGYLNGMQHGTSTSFYSNGQLRFIRMYKENKSFGKHFGYWENGNPKFEFYYLNDKREGVNKQWYQNGQPYAFLYFKNDMEDGMQQAWRENGKPYINYEAKDGFRYGLQKSGLCYTLIDEKMKTTK